MKKIIAAALSILVGAFGYTIVDSAIEDRVATLESEVVELREEVSRYHPEYFDATNNISTTAKNTITHTYEPTTGQKKLSVGDYLTESSNSMHKFALRKWSSSRIEYVSPDRYGISPTTYIYTTATTTKKLTTTQTPTATTTKQFSTTLSASDDIVVTRAPGQTVIATNTNLTYKDYFLYITNDSAQITDFFNGTSNSYYYDKDYSKASTAVNRTTTSVTITCKGYTDPVFAGKEVVFYVSGFGAYSPTKVISNTINSDGSFEYEAIYSVDRQLYNNDYYLFNSISVS